MPTSRATRVTSDANDRSWSTIVLMASLSCRISPRTSTVIFLDRSPLATAIVTSAILRTWAVRLPAIRLTDSVRSFHTPETPLHLRLAAELALGADFARHARDFRREHRKLFDHRVDQLRRAQKLAFERAAVDFQIHRLAEIALGHRADGAGDVDGRPHQVVDQGIDRIGLDRPIADGPGQRHALLEAALLADGHAQPPDFAGDALFADDRLVEGLGDAPVDAGPIRRAGARRNPRRERRRTPSKSGVNALPPTLPVACACPVHAGDFHSGN